MEEARELIATGQPTASVPFTSLKALVKPTGQQESGILLSTLSTQIDLLQRRMLS